MITEGGAADEREPNVWMDNLWDTRGAAEARVETRPGIFDGLGCRP